MDEKITASGLSSSQAAQRLEKFGFNEIKPTKGFSSLKIFFNQFKSPLIYVLVLAGIVTLLIEHFTDSMVIFAAVVINTILGFYQEQKSQKSMVALRSLLTPVAKVIRDNRQQMMAAKELVPGDLVVLTIGVRVPADGILIESTDLTVDEAILTGESKPVDKKAKPNLSATESALEKQPGLVFAGTTVLTGIGKMVITKTGMSTRLGKMGKIVMSLVEEKTPLQIQIGKIAQNLALVIAAIAILLFLLGKLVGYETLQIFTTSVAVAVAAVPEGLVVTLTVVLSLGMQRILKRKALVRQLLATETLGSVSVICADKTGTLTEGKMKVIGFKTADETTQTKNRLIEAAVLCNDLRDPLELAMMAWAQRLMNKEKLLKAHPRLDEIPFNPQDKYIATLHPGIIFLSGAPEIILKKSKMTSSQIKSWQKKFEEYGQRGYRLVGFAYKNIRNQTKSKIQKAELNHFQWLGILLYEDPVREGVKAALKQCQLAGIKVKVITGDYLSTSLSVLRKLGLDDHQQALEGQALQKMSFEDLKKKVGEIVLFARTTPEQKLKIVQALKEQGEVVAMMGDGVNDAPALKQADIGIVVKTASDLSRETAEMVLLDSDFATIVHAVEEGRSIFETIKKVTLYLLSHSFIEIILISGSLLFRLPLPLTAAQILWINLFQDSFPAMALAFEPQEKDLMRQKPRSRQAPIIDLQIKTLLLLVAFLSPAFLTILLVASLKGLLPFHFSQTLVFATLGVISMFVVLACRSLKRAFRYDLFKNPSLIGALGISLILLLMAIYWPPLQVLLKTQSLPLKEWAWIVLFGFLNLLAVELMKLFFILKRRSL
ncbi:HAD-IC family P-type ATPase [Candidatus Shapirobacteria bacterium]|nr:HAD-IC family P-type ATPase [Candidatus Shapirobacteria bacterium]